MARWRLLAPHYINVLDTGGDAVEWEYEEIDKNTGKVARKRYPVPLHLDPNDPTDHNYPGEIIVADKPSRQYNRDYVMVGKISVTQDMQPLDDEAEKISDEARKKWAHPIDSIPMNNDLSPLAPVRHKADVTVRRM